MTTIFKRKVCKLGFTQKWTDFFCYCTLGTKRLLDFSNEQIHGSATNQTLFDFNEK